MGGAVVLVCAFIACVGDDPAGTSSSSSSGSSGNSGVDGSSPTGDEGGPGACASPKVICADRCVDTSNDATHCGACGAVCNGTCFEGVCNGNKVVSVAAQSGGACALRASGSVWCWGRNDAAGLGARTVPDTQPCGEGVCRATPIRVEGLPAKITKLAGGFGAMCAIAENGEVYCWGRNAHSLLGDSPSEVCGAEPCLVKPTKMPNIGPVSDVSLGLGNACVRTLEKKVFCQGTYNDYNQRGTANGLAPLTPTEVVLPFPVDQVAVAASAKTHVCARAGAKVYCWGSTQNEEIKASASSETCAVSGGKCVKTPYEIPGISDAVEIAVGDGHTCVRRTGGPSSVSCFGWNGYGVGSNNQTLRVIQEMADAVEIVGRGNHVCARKPSGAVVCIGNNEEAQVGVIAASHVPVSPCAITPCRPDFNTVGGLNATRIDVMLGFSVAVRFDGVPVAWGGNQYAALGRFPRTNGDLTCPVSASATLPCQPTPQVIPGF